MGGDSWRRIEVAELPAASLIKSLIARIIRCVAGGGVETLGWAAALIG
ncbi:hypothetical protein AB0F52_15695 [Amycolatopsis sp. NPDC024027]